jgi:antitoxin CcdA
MGKPGLNLHIDEDLLAKAQAVGVSAERVAEEAVRRAITRADPAGAEARAAKWAEENAEAIKAHRERIEKFGVFGEDFRA